MQSSSPASHEASFDDQPSRKSRPRLLVVEDAQCIQKKLGGLLETMEMDVDLANNGQMACEMAEKSKAEGTPYDLIFMDIQMSTMTGEAATRWLREHDWQGSIVAVSVLGDHSDHEQFFEAGCDDYLAKPFTKATLREVLERYLGEGK